MGPRSDHFRDGRYRFSLGRSLDPHEDLHPEMRDHEVFIGTDVPSTIDELISMQKKSEPEEARPHRPEECDRRTAKVQRVLELIGDLETTADEDKTIALILVQRLEEYHDRIVGELTEDTEAKHSQITAWAVDADRLMHCRILLDSIEVD
jgi:hypothetical protein